MSKYKTLWEYIKNNGEENLILSFNDIENILGFPIDHSFLKYKNEINDVEYIITHFMKAKFINVANNLDKIIGIKRSSFKSICVRFGSIKKVYELN